VHEMMMRTLHALKLPTVVLERPNNLRRSHDY
jgi:hypothetical protein